MQPYIRVVFFAFLLVVVPIRAHAAVRITEIAWMGIAGEGGQFGEWLELYNDSDTSVSLSDWKLYGDGGGQLLFTFSKTIPSGGYLLVERTTASMTDPVPSIDDEHGTFGGGGMANTGEDLVLKDASGAVVQSLNYAVGWPAGDPASKETMQWTGASWITASGTPKSETVSSGDTSGDNTDDDTSNTGTDSDNDDTDNESQNGSESPKVTIKSKPKKELVRPDPHIELVIPRAMDVHSPYRFTANVYTKDDRNPPKGVYRWNFGDGTAVESYKRLEPVMYTYQYPGTYTLWFGYYETAFDQDPLLFLATTVSVRLPDLTVSVVDGAAVRIQNNADMKVDLSSWALAAGEYRAVLPPMTILAPRASIVMPAATLHIPVANGVQLFTPDGFLAHVTTDTGEVLGAEVMAAAPIVDIPVVSEPVLGEEQSIVDSGVVIAPIEMPIEESLPLNPYEAQTPKPRKANSARTWLLGAVAFSIVGLFILLERLTAKRE
jgi:hypothetical protein